MGYSNCCLTGSTRTCLAADGALGGPGKYRVLGGDLTRIASCYFMMIISRSQNWNDRRLPESSA